MVPHGGLHRHSGCGACHGSRARAQANSHFIEYSGFFAFTSFHEARHCGSQHEPQLVPGGHDEASEAIT